MKISKRLQTIASYVDDHSHVIDVGCDHALLDIYLVLNKPNVKVLASDINQGPLNGAKVNIMKYHLADKISVGLHPGLKGVNASIDTAIIAGMGGNTMIDILETDRDKLTNIKTLILAPQNSWYEVRQKIAQLGYAIAGEEILYEHAKAYLLIKAVKAEKGPRYSDYQLRYGPILLATKPTNFLKYYQELLIKNKEIVQSLSDTNIDREKINDEIKRLEIILDI